MDRFIKLKFIIIPLLIVLLVGCTRNQFSPTVTETTSTDISASDNADFRYGIGDINKDGYIDENDLNLLQDYFDEVYIFDEEELSAADVDGNGVVDSADYIMLKSMIPNT